MALDPLKADAIRTEATPPQMSLYLPLNLGIGSVLAQETGVFVPEKYKKSDSIDLVVYLRGYDVNRPAKATSVGQYWNSPQHKTLYNFQLRDEVNKSGKNVILAVPTLGPSSEFGKLNNDGDAKEFLIRISDALRLKGPHVGLTTGPTLRHLILAAHSGGGVPLRRLSTIYGDDAGGLKDKLKACWGFDCTYGVNDSDADFWAKFAKDHSGTKITMYYIFTQRAVGKNPNEPVGRVGKNPKEPIGPVGKDPKKKISDKNPFDHDNPYDHDNPFDHYEPTGTTFPAMELERLAKKGTLGNVAVVRETKAMTLDHNAVPRTHLKDLLKAAKYLDDL